MKEEFKPITRREFLKSAGKTALSAVALSTLPVSLSACGASSEAATTAAMTAAAATTAASETQDTAEASIPATVFPWKYIKLDDFDKLKEHTYKVWYEYGGCGGGAFGGIMDLLAEASKDTGGYPYNQIPAKIFLPAHSGYMTGQFCGSLTGAIAAMALFVDNADDIDKMSKQLQDWYAKHEFPQYKPEALKFGEPYNSTTTVANSVTCAASVGLYMETTGYEKKSDERKARCAGLTAEVVEKAVHLLNQYFGYEAAEPEETTAAAKEPELAANEYIGTANSEIGGELKVKVTMDGDKIAKVEVLSHNDTTGICEPAIKQIPDAIVKANSADVDAVSGATKTSQAIMAAVKDALSQVK